MKSKKSGPSIPPTVKAQQAIELIKGLIEGLEKTIQLKYDDPQVDAWEAAAKNRLNAIFGQPNGEMDERTYDVVYGTKTSFQIGMGEDEWQDRHIKEQGKRKAILHAYLEDLKILNPFTEDSNQNDEKTEDSKGIFIVHGHDHLSMRELQNYLITLNLRPIVLSDEPNKGSRSLIEKFEENAKKASYAIIFITPDDLVKKETSINGVIINDYKQMRLNVAFELGWFFGKIGRDKVCILYKEGTYTPTDLEGIAHHPFKEKVSEIFYKIVEELKAVAFYKKP